MDKIKYSGDLNDLLIFTTKVEELYYISFKDNCYKLDKQIFFNSYNKAKSNLVKHLYHNFCQGHYWHKNKDNTFSKNMGWERNGGNVNMSKDEF